MYRNKEEKKLADCEQSPQAALSCQAGREGCVRGLMKAAYSPATLFAASGKKWLHAKIQPLHYKQPSEMKDPLMHITQTAHYIRAVFLNELPACSVLCH